MFIGRLKGNQALAVWREQAVRLERIELYARGKRKSGTGWRKVRREQKAQRETGRWNQREIEWGARRKWALC